MFCGAKTMFDPRDRFEKNLCECRHDMDFDTKNMECRIHLKVDCTNAKKDETLLESNLVKLMNGQIEEPDQEYTPDQIRDGFCNLLDSVADEYKPHESILAEVAKSLSFIFTWVTDLLHSVRSKMEDTTERFLIFIT